VPAGDIDPEQVITPGIFVNGVVEIADSRQEEELVRAGVAYA
jgi:3-oxoadipate CoA-transferase alpha subunit